MPPAEGGRADHRLNEPELAVAGGPNQVAAHRDLQSGRQAQPLHGSHGGDRDLREATDQQKESLEQLAGRRLVATDVISTLAPAEK